MKKTTVHLRLLVFIPILWAFQTAAGEPASKGTDARNACLFGTDSERTASVHSLAPETLATHLLFNPYPHAGQIGGFLAGNNRPNPYFDRDTYGLILARLDGNEFLRGFDADGTIRAWGKYTNDRDAQEWFGRGKFVVGSEGSNNAIVGFVSNNLPPATPAFPTAVTGVSYNKGNGNAVFSMYGESHATVPGLAIGAEFAAFQDGTPAPPNLPFENSIGTPQTIAKSLQLTAGSGTEKKFAADVTKGSAVMVNVSSTAGLFVGQLVEGTGIPWASTIVAINAENSSISINANATLSRKQADLHAVNPAGVATEIGREGSTRGVFQTANFVQRDAALQWSYYQDNSNQSGPRNGMYLGYNGVGIGAIFQPSVNVNPNNAVVVINDATGVAQATIRQNGHAYFGSSSSIGSVLTLENVDGTCTFMPAATSSAFACSSDEAMKKNISDARSVLDWISSFRIREYDLRSTGQHLYGVIAQEVQKTHPGMIHVAEDGTLLVDTPNPWIVARGIQELRQENESLKLELRVVEAVGVVGFLLCAWRNLRCALR